MDRPEPPQGFLGDWTSDKEWTHRVIRQWLEIIEAKKDAEETPSRD